MLSRRFPVQPKIPYKGRRLIWIGISVHYGCSLYFDMNRLLHIFNPENPAFRFFYAVLSRFMRVHTNRRTHCIFFSISTRLLT